MECGVAVVGVKGPYFVDYLALCPANLNSAIMYWGRTSEPNANAPFGGFHIWGPQNFRIFLPPPLFVCKIYTVCPQICCISSVRTSYMEAIFVESPSLSLSLSLSSHRIPSLSSAGASPSRGWCGAGHVCLASLTYLPPHADADTNKDGSGVIGNAETSWPRLLGFQIWPQSCASVPFNNRHRKL